MFAIETKTYTISSNLHGHGFVQRGHHLAGEETIIDQLIQVILLLGQAGLDLIGRAMHVRGANGLVSVLRILAALILNGRIRKVLRSESAPECIPATRVMASSLMRTESVRI